MSSSKQQDWFAHDQVTVIKPRQGLHILNISELWAYRDLWLTLIMRDIKVRYKQTVLGVAWAVIQPVTTMLIFTLIFGRLAKIPSDGMPYPIFVFSGLLAWNLFSSAISSAGNSLVGASSLITKVYFPRIIVPLSSLGVASIDFLIASGILMLMMMFYGIAISLKLLLLPVLLFGLLTTAVGIGVWLAAITVTYRDFRFVIPFMVQIWMYVTPVVYPISFLPEGWRWLMYCNPLVGWISGFRAAFLDQPIDWLAIGSSGLFSIVLLVVGLRYFVKVETRFADVI
ncbi:MAG: ABC transporter permease [Arenicella sp.]